MSTQISESDLKRRVNYRCEIEKFCNIVDSLPPVKQIVFKYGYRLIDIADVCGVCQGTISRRLKKIAKEVGEMLYGASGGRYEKSPTNLLEEITANTQPDTKSCR